MTPPSSSRSGRRSSSRRNRHGGFHRVAPNHSGGGRERRRVAIDTNEAYCLYRRYEATPRDVKLPDRWHLNPNRVPIPPPHTSRERSLAIAEHRWLAGPELLADPRYAEEGPAWDALFQGEQEAASHSFFAAELPEWFLRYSVTPPGSNDEDVDSSDDEDASELYQPLPEEMSPSGWWKDRHDRKGPDSRNGGGYAGASSSAPVIID